MGKRSDELQREIAEYRERLDAKVDRLDARVRSDIEESRETLNADVRERLQLDKIDQYADERPLLTLAVAFGTGVLLGSVAPSVPTPSMPSRNGGSKQQQSQSQSSGTGGGGGFLSGIMGSASGSLTSAIEDEVRNLVSQVTGRQQSSQSSQRSSGSRRDIDRHEDAAPGYERESFEAGRAERGAFRGGSDR